ncbi:LysM peptidoglycan-binding domain-containing protein [Agromyces intestinalis]|uniref:LysM peptidoglycan-binding domain-containing protein n=1 Tax=Agromyces intestinalis TaxID=2592652 RepID=A0A5C1YE55_9MICO|nr:LysM peptidoglycan-binding domain-containing protein [Agromyces intestinalis]QEO13287.1 LysM peptidoglycan-binding domain-containing protein [Agromyces intestinalis]
MSSFAATGSIGGYAPPPPAVLSSATSSQAGASPVSGPGTPLAPRTRLRLTRRGRVVLTAVAGVPIALFTAMAVLGAGAAAADTDPVRGATSFRTVTVATGDTLWELAESIAPGEDPREIIDEIVRLNGLRDAIQPGQQLALPVFE